MVGDDAQERAAVLLTGMMLVRGSWTLQTLTTHKPPVPQAIGTVMGPEVVLNSEHLVLWTDAEPCPSQEG